MADRVQPPTGFFDEEACDLGEFEIAVGRTANKRDFPHADDVQKNVPIFDMSPLRLALEDSVKRRKLMGEWASVLMSGPGVMVLRNAFAETGVLDKATSIFQTIIAEEKETAGRGGDHFAATGANDRVWNSLQKLCLRAPDVFLDYFSNTAIASVCEAWLGPHYQMTAQVNLVRPGGAAQEAHRDYHLGFQSADVCTRYPIHVHDLSPVLTLQGAVAHSDMPLESGPTKLLPFSQTYRPGYAAWRRKDFRDYFEDNHVQLPLSKGDVVFFNPALFHAAGANTSANIQRMANLLQVSSAFGRAMENIDRDAMCKAMYPSALANLDRSENEISAAIAACAEGYSFPTNLDRVAPDGGMAPETQAAIFRRALQGRLPADEFNVALDEMLANQRA